MENKTYIATILANPGTQALRYFCHQLRVLNIKYAVTLRVKSDDDLTIKFSATTEEVKQIRLSRHVKLEENVIETLPTSPSTLRSELLAKLKTQVIAQWPLIRNYGTGYEAWQGYKAICLTISSLGDQDMVRYIEADNYPPCGMPVMEKIAAKYGLAVPAGLGEQVRDRYAANMKKMMAEIKPRHGKKFG